MRRISVYFTLVLLLTCMFPIMLFGSGNKENKNEMTGEPGMEQTRKITDMSGREVILPIPAHIQRIAILTSPQVLIAFLLDEENKLCSITNAVKKWSRLPSVSPVLGDVPAVRGRYAQVNIEALLQSNPDICIGSVGDMQAVEKSTTLTTLHITNNKPGEYFKHLKEEVRFIGMVLGKTDAADAYCEYLDSVLSDIRKKTGSLSAAERTKVFLGFGPDHLVTYGSGTYMQEWLDAVNINNAAGEINTSGGREGGLSSVSMEQVLLWDPDVIIIDEGNPDELINNPAWSGLKAVKNENVFRLPVGLFIWNRPSVEAAVLFPFWLATKAYPDEFDDIDMEDVLGDFYSGYFGFDPDKNEIKSILFPLDM